MRVLIDRTKCIGSGNCVLAAPAIFTQDERDGMVVMLDENPAEDRLGEIEEAAENCPARVISIE